MSVVTAEESALFNGPFMAALLRLFVDAHGGAVDVERAYIALPIALHSRSRKALPSIVTTSLPVWLKRHSVAKRGFPERASRLVPFVRDGLVLGVASDVLVLDGTKLKSGSAPLAGGGFATDEVRACFAAATFLGKWFARGVPTPTLYGLFGVTP